jgi:hypothetical protein
MTMNRWWVVSCVLVATVGLGGAVLKAAQGGTAGRGRQLLEGPQFQKPPSPPAEDFKKLMRANDDVMSVDGAAGDNGADAATAGAIQAGQTSFRGSLSKALGPEPDFEVAMRDIGTLRANFAQLETFFTALPSPDALELIRAGQKAIGDLDTAVKAKDRIAGIRAQIELSHVCRNCHIGHRVLVIAAPLTYAIIS